MSVIGLLLRFYRFQVIAVLITALGVAGAAACLAVQLNGLNVDAACFGAVPPAAEETCASLGRFRELGGFNVVRLMGFLGFVPFVGGVLLGAPVVAREIEHQTAVLPWSLDGRRSRWLLERIGLLAVVLGIALLAPTFAAWLLAEAAEPGIDPRASFEYYGMHGPLLVLRAVLTFSIGILLGALLGRVLPAVIAAAAAAVLLFFVLGVLQERWVEPETVVATVNRSGHESDATMFVGGGYRDASGTLLTREEMEALSPEPLYTEAFNDWVAVNFETLTLEVSGERYPEVELREGVALGAASVVTIGLTLVIVRRRRPY